MADNEKSVTLKKIAGTLLITILIVFGFASLLSESILYSKNTLLNQGGWVSTQEYLQAKTMAPNHFYYQRNAVSGNKLDLSAWHGYQEVSPDFSFPLARVGFDFSLAENSYLSVLFNRDSSGFEGVRLSRNIDYPSIYFKAGPLGDFTEVKALDGAVIGEGWMSFGLKAAEGAITFSFQDQKIAEFPFKGKAKQIVSLRGGKHEALIDNFVVQSADGAILFESDFTMKAKDASFQTKMLGYSLLCFVVFLAIGVIFRRKSGLFAGYSTALRMQFVAGLTLASVLLFDLYHWSEIYLAKVYNPTGQASSDLLLQLEQKRIEFFDADIPDSLGTYLKSGEYVNRVVDPFVLKSISKGKPEWVVIEQFHASGLGEKILAFEDADALTFQAKSKNELRIGYVGSSQTFGVGATSMEDTLSAQTQKILAKKMPDKKVVTLNFGVPGSWSKALVDRYRKSWQYAGLDVLIINLSHNDYDPTILEQCLREFLFINKELGIKTAFILEATNPEYDTYVADNHDSMRAVAKDWGVPIFDLYALYRQSEVRDSGFLWWDSVHHTDLGQKVAAEAISNFFVKEVVPARVASMKRIATKGETGSPKG